jgi:hypothetical protein
MNKLKPDDLERMIVEVKALQVHFHERQVPYHVGAAAMLELLALMSAGEPDTPELDARKAVDACCIRLREFHQIILDGRRS